MMKCVPSSKHCWPVNENVNRLLNNPRNFLQNYLNQYHTNFVLGIYSGINFWFFVIEKCADCWPLIDKGVQLDETTLKYLII